jgi:hypothetical protein
MYTGQTYQLPLQDGWSANTNHDATILSNLDNINLHNGGCQPRGGTDLVSTTSTHAIKGIKQYIPEDGNLLGFYVTGNGDHIIDELGNHLVTGGSAVITCNANGDIHKNYSDVLKSGLTANSKYSIEQFYGKVYIANGNDVPQVYDKQFDYTYDFGTPPACTATLGSGAGNVDNGTHYYKITFLSTGDKESTLGVVSAVVTVVDKSANGKVELTNIPISENTSCTKRRIYRTKAGGTTYFHLYEITNNTTTVFTDNVADSSLPVSGVTTPTTNLAFCPTDWQSAWPKYFMKHSRGNQTRLCAFGCEDYPNRFYMAANGEPDFSDATVTVINMLDNRITGATEFGQSIIMFSDTDPYILDDSDATVSNWGLQKATWSGGTANHNLIVKTPTDVLVVNPDMNIYSIVTTQKYGDMEIGSISKPIYLQKWIKENIDTARMDAWFGFYDPDIRAVKFFITRIGDNEPRDCLVYFIDKPPDKAWSKHSYGISHNCHAVFQESEFDWKIYTGGNSGYTYRLESDTLLDVASIYQRSLKTSPLILDNPRNLKQFDKIWIVLKPQGTETLSVDVDIDNRALATQYIDVTAASDILQNYSVFVGAIGQREEVEIISNDGEDFFLSALLIDFKDLKSV